MQGGDPTNKTHSIVTAMFVPVGLARSKGAAQGGIKLFSTVHVQPNILLRGGIKKVKEKRVQETELAGRSFLKVAKKRACTEIVAMKTFVLSLLLPHHFLLGKRGGKISARENHL